MSMPWFAAQYDPSDFSLSSCPQYTTFRPLLARFLITPALTITAARASVVNKDILIVMDNKYT
jgi:hypothetical protein